MSGRAALGAAVAGALLLGAAAPDHPVRFLAGDALKALVDREVRVDIVDVRAPAQCAEVLDEGLPGWWQKGYPVAGTDTRARPRH